MANFVTLARIVLIVPFIAVFLADAPWNMTVALVIFVIASLTDFLDGWIARARKETSTLGAALDPIADKLLIATALILLVRNGVIQGAGVIAVIVIILREVLVSGLREALAANGISLAVSTLAKWKTAVQLVAAAFLLASAPYGIAGEAWRPLATGLLWLAAVLTFWTGADYALKASRRLAGGEK